MTRENFKSSSLHLSCLVFTTTAYPTRTLPRIGIVRSAVIASAGTTKHTNNNVRTYTNASTVLERSKSSERVCLSRLPSTSLFRIRKRHRFGHFSLSLSCFYTSLVFVNNHSQYDQDSSFQTCADVAIPGRSCAAIVSSSFKHSSAGSYLWQ